MCIRDSAVVALEVRRVTGAIAAFGRAGARKVELPVVERDRLRVVRRIGRAGPRSEREEEGGEGKDRRPRTERHRVTIPSPGMTRPNGSRRGEGRTCDERDKNHRTNSHV